ncbi:MAG: rhodanese-like domain-containing protein [Betaproteobacteria bacterium]|nr:rhodanese-like domain-containing protein [Betaproteobacteria bacterium]
MKERHGIIGGLFSRLSMALFMAGRTACMAQVKDISSVELMQRIKAKRAGLILDVRSPQEYAEGHIPGAINIPYKQLGSRLAEIASHKNKEIVLYCRSGGCAGIAANTLRAEGFCKLLHLAGDMNGWRSNGSLPVKHSNGQAC